MRLARLAFAFALAFAALALPTGSASWMAVGGLEPSTSFDRNSGMMWADPDTSHGPPKIYFQAFQSVDQMTLDPNVAALGSRIQPPGAAHHRAMLGYWRDCNDDGYIGLAESAIQDYHSEILLDPSICPVGSVFNDGQWVSEIIGIGAVDPCQYQNDSYRATYCGGIPVFHNNPRVLIANGTMVWADTGAPGGVPPAECGLEPLPPGTTSGTGAMLEFADCQDGRRVAAQVNALDPDGSKGLRFDDIDHPERSSSALNVAFPVTLFGGPQGAGALQAGSGSPAFTLWDCSQPHAESVKDPTGGALHEVVVNDPSGGHLTGPQPALPVVGVLTPFPDDDQNPATPGRAHVVLSTDDGSIVWAPAPAPDVNDPTASSWDALELAADGPRGDCDPTTPSPLRAAAPGAIVEGGDPQVDEAQKDRASLAFTFYNGHRGLNDNIDFVLGPQTPADGGLIVKRDGRGGDGPLWNADESSINEPQLISRGSLALSGAQYWTYYAKIGDAAFAAGLEAPGSTATYGSEACGSFTSGVRNGWVCDGSAWYKDALGRDATPRYLTGEAYAPVPGERYQLRDVDCYDGQLAEGSGIFASGSAVSGDVCD